VFKEMSTELHEIELCYDVSYQSIQYCGRQVLYQRHQRYLRSKCSKVRTRPLELQKNLTLKAYNQTEISGSQLNPHSCHCLKTVEFGLNSLSIKLCESMFARMSIKKVDLAILMLGDRGSTVFKVLCYKSEGRWFDFR